MIGLVKLNEDGQWILAKVQPSHLGGYDAKIGDTIFCGISEDNVRLCNSNEDELN